MTHNTNNNNNEYWSVDKKNQLVVNFCILYFSSNSRSTCCFASMDALPTNRSWPPTCSHGTYQHKAITSRSGHLLMMGTRLPETCWATIRRKIKTTKSDIYLVLLNHTELRCTVNRTSEYWSISNYAPVHLLTREFQKLTVLQRSMQYLEVETVSRIARPNTKH
jgi:hypothetical protein